MKTLNVSVFSLLVTSLLTPTVSGQVVVSPYDWFQVGAYAKYTSTWAPDGLIFPNGTIVRIMPPSDMSPATAAILEWTIIDKAGGAVRLNLTFSINCKNITFHKQLVLDVNIYTRDAVIDGEEIGKTCFWAEPYAEVGQGIVLYGNSSDQIEGNVIRVVTENVLGREVKEYFVDVPVRIDPCLCMTIYPRFVWHTGMAEAIVLVGSRPIGPNEEVGLTFENGTRFAITRFSSTPLGEKLCIYAGSATYALYLNETNVRLGPETEAGEISDIGLLKYSPHILVAAVAVSTVTFIISYRRRNKMTDNRQNPQS